MYVYSCENMNVLCGMCCCCMCVQVIVFVCLHIRFEYARVRVSMQHIILRHQASMRTIRTCVFPGPVLYSSTQQKRCTEEQYLSIRGQEVTRPKEHLCCNRLVVCTKPSFSICLELRNFKCCIIISTPSAPYPGVKNGARRLLQNHQHSTIFLFLHRVVVPE